MKLTIREMCACGLMAALLCVLAPVSIPLAGEVPVSLATLAVMLCGALLGPFTGTLAVLVYIILGSLGLPVFAGWTSGLHIVFGVTGGYIIGYLALACITGYAYELAMARQKGFLRSAIQVSGMVTGTAVLYLIGTSWFCKATGTPPVPALSVCVFPFLPGDMAKIFITVLLSERLETAAGLIRRRMTVRP